MNAALVVCAACVRPVEGVLLASAAPGYYAHEPYARTHERAHGHYPERVHILPACPPALLLIGRRP